MVTLDQLFELSDTFPFVAEDLSVRLRLYPEKLLAKAWAGTLEGDFENFKAIVKEMHEDRQKMLNLIDREMIETIDRDPDLAEDYRIYVEIHGGNPGSLRENFASIPTDFLEREGRDA